jgi:two-component system sensor histidine kinase DesK
VREAVTNIQRHARAQRASIEVLALAEERGREKGVLLNVTDDGRGGINAEGNGLAGIRERVQSLGGTLDIHSPGGEGTRVRVRVPLLASAVSAPGGRPRVLRIETVTGEETGDVNANARAVHT